MSAAEAWGSLANPVARSGTGWRMVREAAGVRATFEGVLGAEEGRRSARALDELMGTMPHVDLVFEVTRMEGYANEARQAWQATMKERRKQIRSLTTIGAKPIVRLGASLLGMIAGVLVRHQ
jgi:hypothetical protein